MLIALAFDSSSTMRDLSPSILDLSTFPVDAGAESVQELGILQVVVFELGLKVAIDIGEKVVREDFHQHFLPPCFANLSVTIQSTWEKDR